MRGSLTVLILLSGCTSISDPSLLSMRALDCFGGGSCSCIRSVVDIVAPTVQTSGTGLAAYKDLTPFLNTAPLPTVRYGMSEGVGNHFLGNDFYIMNRYGIWLLRNGQRINNYMAIVTKFRIGLPATVSQWVQDNIVGATLDLAVLTNSGGARIRTRASGATAWQTVVNAPGYQRSRLQCAPQNARITLTPGQWTDVELISNISDGNNLAFQPRVYTNQRPDPGEETEITRSAYGGAALLVGIRWREGVTGVPRIDPDLSGCGQDFYHTFDDLAANLSSLTHDQLGIGQYKFFVIPKEWTEVTVEDAAANGNLPVCGYN